MKPKIALHLALPRNTWENNLRLLFRRLEVDRAVVYLLMTRGLQVLTYPVTMVLITHYLTREAQGFYYTFASLLALQIFVELGFVIAIINIASHEWSRLELDKTGRIMGDQQSLSRLISLGRLIFKWYAVASLIFVVGVSLLGWFLFSQSTYPAIEWQSPWVTLVVLSGLLLWTLPFIAMLEGCNQVAVINSSRLSQMVLESLALWGLLLVGWGLWAAVAAVGVKLLRNAYLLFIQYRHFWEPFLKPALGPCINWKTEVWPMQWRLAASASVSYLSFSLFNPIMFYYHGAAVAGQMGMTLQVVNGLQLVAMAWISTKVPRFGILIARKEYAILDKFWLRTSLVSLAVISCGSGVLFGLICILNVLQLGLSQRLLRPLPTGLFLFTAILMQVGQCLVVYLRAHKQEPILIPGVISGIVTGFLVWLLGSQFGPLGATAGYFAQMVVHVIWIAMIWARCRIEWHKG